MCAKRLLSVLAAVALLGAIPPQAGAQTPVSTAFTYQGQLKQSGAPYNGEADLAFSLYDAAAGGNITGGPVWIDDVNVVNGLFTVTVDFGAPAFAGNDRWLEIQIGHPPTVLSPRTKLTSAPFAIRAGDLDMPFSGTSDTGTQTLFISNTDTGKAGYFAVDNATSASSALAAATNGGGSAGHFENNNAGNASPALYAETNGSGDAVSGYTDGTGSAGYFQVNNAASSSSALYVQTNGTGRAVRGYVTGSAGAGYFSAANGSAGKGVYISVPVGNAGLNVASGTKNAVVATSTGARLLYSEESAEVWFTDYGFGRLQGGRAKITIEPTFAETVALAQPHYVFVQLEDLGCAGVGVVNKTPVSFEIGELRGGTSNAEFCYRIVAKRRNYEKARLERAPYADDDENLHPPDEATG